MKNYLVLLLLLSLINTKSTHLLGSNVYENLWESTYKKYSSEKKIDGKLYTIIQSQNLKKSQSFTNITRIYSKPPPSSFTAKEKIVFFINKYNINAIKSNHNPSCITKDAFTEYEKSIINKDFRIPFALGGPNKESANIYAFKEENFDQLLNKAFLEQLKKESSINHDNKTIKVSECFTKNIPNHATQLKYLQQIYPKSRKERYIIFSKSLSNVKK